MNKKVRKKRRTKPKQFGITGRLKASEYAKWKNFCRKGCFSEAALIRALVVKHMKGTRKVKTI